MRIRGIRGAIQLDTDTPNEMVSAVSELLSQMLSANQLETEDLISITVLSVNRYHISMLSNKPTSV